MCDTLPPKKMCSESRDLFKFCEISDNISLTVKDRDIVAIELSLIGNSIWPIEWHHCQCPRRSLAV